MLAAQEERHKEGLRRASQLEGTYKYNLGGKKNSIAFKDEFRGDISNPESSHKLSTLYS